MEEIWKSIAGYEGCYEVSNLGNIKSLSRTVVAGPNSLRTVKEIIRKQRLCRKGYCRVGLSIESLKVNHSVHRLVAEAFIPKVEGKDQVNHIDGVKTNNNISNLEWCTGTENIHHAFSNGLIPRKRLGTRTETYEELRSEILALTAEGCTQAQIAKIYGVTDSTISKYVRGWRRKKIKEHS